MGKRDEGKPHELMWEMSGQKAATGRTWEEQKRFNKKIKRWRARQILILSLPYLPLIAVLGFSFRNRPLEGLYTLGVLLLLVVLAWIALSVTLLICALVAIRIRLWLADAWGDNDFFGMYHSLGKETRQNFISEIAGSLSAFILYLAILINVYKAIFAGKFK